MKTEITLGYVMVYVPIFDCDNVQRAVAFRRVGKTISREPVCHWTANKYIGEARMAAQNAIKDFFKKKLANGK